MRARDDASTGGEFPTYEWGEAPAGLVTRRQLREMNLSPGGHGPVAQIRCRRCLYKPNRNCTRMAMLFRVDLAQPKRTPTPAQLKALDRAMAARQTCPACGVRYPYCLPLRTLGTCWPCSPESQTAAQAITELAA